MPSLDIKEIQLKPQWDTTICIAGWLQLKRLTISSIGKDVKQLKLGYSWKWNMLQPIWKPLLQLKKNKLHLLYDPDIPLGYLPKREREKKKSKFSCTDLYMNLCRSFICNILKSETTQMSITEWLKKLLYIYVITYHSVIKRNESPIYTVTWMSVEIIMLYISREIKKSTFCIVPFI